MLESQKLNVIFYKNQHIKKVSPLWEKKLFTSNAEIKFNRG